jgi:hypothetical protein
MGLSVSLQRQAQKLTIGPVYLGKDEPENAALDHPKIFGPHFGGASWHPWRVFLKALFALPMDDDELALYRRHTERSLAPTEPAHEAALVVGRRGGKSRVLALVAVYLASFRDYGPYLGAGEVATIAVIAANRAQARTIFRYVTGLLRAVPALAQMIKEETADSVTLNNRVVIEIHTASFRVTPMAFCFSSASRPRKSPFFIFTIQPRSASHGVTVSSMSLP